METNDEVGSVRREHRVTAGRTQDEYDRLLASTVGLPNGAHIKPKVVQHIDFYGNGTTYNVQTVRTDEGVTVFIAQQNSQGAVRYILPPAVLAMIDRQRKSISTQVRRRNGKRIAEERAASGLKPGFMK